MNAAGVIVRVVLTALLAAGAAAAVNLFCVIPYRYNVDRARIEATLRNIDAGESLRAPGILRARIDELRRYEHRYPIDVTIYINQGIAYDALDDEVSALQAWTRGLAYDKRPEMFLGMAAAAARSGRRDNAVRYLVVALRANPVLRKTIRNFILDEDLARRALAAAPGS